MLIIFCDLIRKYLDKLFINFFLKLLSSINQMRSDNEQMQIQYQQYNANVQRHIQELNEQVRLNYLSFFSLFKMYLDFR